jgi:tetratricopeptide (TPR) repeat protein
VAAFVVAIACALFWAYYDIPLAVRWFRQRRRGPAVAPGGLELHAAAEEAEQWAVRLGTGTGGLAAAEWFSMNESRLRDLLLTEKARDETADDLTRICDALEVWYLRRYEPGALLELSEFLAAVAEATGRRDLTELAAARMATAYRLMGDLEGASTRVGVSANVATHSRTSAAMTTRRHVERALVHLERAKRAPTGNDRDEAVLNARDRLGDAQLHRPDPDLAAEVAIHINLAIVHLYQQDPGNALDHLQTAAARATNAGDISGHAHAIELQGVAAWMQHSPHEAKGWWEHAQRLYAEIDEPEGRARCLQHLGSAEVVAGRFDKGLKLLEQSALLRQSDSDLLTTYLEAARRTGKVPAVNPDPAPNPTIGRLRRRLTQLRNHFS